MTKIHSSGHRHLTQLFTYESHERNIQTNSSGEHLASSIEDKKAETYKSTVREARYETYGTRSTVREARHETYDTRRAARDWTFVVGQEH